MSNTLIDQPALEGKVSDWLYKPEIKNRLTATIGGWMDGESFLGQILVAFQDDRLKGCSPKSLFIAAHEMAALQLLPTLDQVALVPYNNTKRDESGREWIERECQVTLQYQGMVTIMRRSPEIHDVEAVLVHVNDQFEYVNGMMTHEYDPFGDRAFNGLDDIRGGYLRVKWHDRQLEDKIVFVTKKEFEQAKKASKKKSNGPWQHYFMQMAQKTIIRRAFTQRAVSIDPMVAMQVNTALAVENKVLENEPAGMDKPKQLSSDAVTKAINGGAEIKAQTPVIEAKASPISTPKPKDEPKEAEPEVQVNMPFNGEAPEWDEEYHAELGMAATPEEVSEIKSRYEGEGFDTFVNLFAMQRVAELAGATTTA